MTTKKTRKPKKSKMRYTGDDILSDEIVDQLLRGKSGDDLTGAGGLLQQIDRQTRDANDGSRTCPVSFQQTFVSHAISANEKTHPRLISANFRFTPYLYEDASRLIPKRTSIVL